MHVYWFGTSTCAEANECSLSPESFTTHAQLKKVENLSVVSSAAGNVGSRQRSVGNSAIQDARDSNVLQHTKSLPHLARNGEVTPEKMKSASTQFNALMIEVYLCLYVL